MRNGEDSRGPTEDRQFRWRVVYATGALLVGFAVVLIFWFQVQILLLAFAGVLLGVFLYTISAWLSRWLRTPYSPSVPKIGGGAILIALVTIAAAFGFGYLAGCGRDHLEDVGGLGTAQRNTAAGLIIATQNFDDPGVLVMLTVANAMGIVLLLFLAKTLRHDNPAGGGSFGGGRPHGRGGKEGSQDTKRLK